MFVTGDGDKAREMKRVGRFQSTSLVSAWRRLRMTQAEMRWICKCLAAFETRVCIFYVRAPFSEVVAVRWGGIAHANQDGNFSPMAGIHITVKLNESGAQAKVISEG